MPSRAVKVNPIAIIDFILTWGGEGRGGEGRDYISCRVLQKFKE